MTDKKNGREYLGYVLEKLKERITEISLSLVEGQKEIEGMHEYYWENYTEMDQYGYENYDNQQALFRQISANEEQLILKQRFRRMADSPFFGSGFHLRRRGRTGDLLYWNWKFCRESRAYSISIRLACSGKRSVL